MDQLQFLMSILYVAFFSMIGVLIYLYIQIKVRQIRFEQVTNKVLNALAVTSYSRFKDLVLDGETNFEEHSDFSEYHDTHKRYVPVNDLHYINSSCACKRFALIRGNMGNFIKYVFEEKNSISVILKNDTAILNKIYPKEIDNAYKTLMTIKAKHVDMYARANFLKDVLYLDKIAASLLKTNSKECYVLDIDKHNESLIKYFKSLKYSDNYLIYCEEPNLSIDDISTVNMKVRCYCFAQYPKPFPYNDFFRNGDIVVYRNNADYSDVFSKKPFVFDEDIVANTLSGAQVINPLDSRKIEINNPEFISHLMPATLEEALPFFKQAKINGYKMPDDVFASSQTGDLYPMSLFTNIYMPLTLTLIPDEFYK